MAISRFTKFIMWFTCIILLHVAIITTAVELRTNGSYQKSQNIKIDITKVGEAIVEGDTGSDSGSGSSSS